MNADEALKLCRYVKACCPQQAIDEYTPLAWADHLADYPYEDAMVAAKQLTGRQAFVNISEILDIVKKVRAKRITEAGDLTPPPGLTQPEERAWLVSAHRRIGDGQPLEVDYGELKPRHLPDLRALMRRAPEETA